MSSESDHCFFESFFEGFGSFFDEDDTVGDEEFDFGDFVFYLSAVFKFKDYSGVDDFVEEMFEFEQFGFDSPEQFYVGGEMNGFGLYSHNL